MTYQLLDNYLLLLLLYPNDLPGTRQLLDNYSLTTASCTYYLYYYFVVSPGKFFIFACLDINSGAFSTIFQSTDISYYTLGI